MNESALPEGWARITIEDILLSLESGSRPKGGVRAIKEGIPSIGGEHLLYNGGFDFTDIRYVPNEFYKKMTRGKILNKDVLVVKDGATTGKTSFVSDSFPFSESAVNEHVFILRVFHDYTDSKYLFFWMESPYGQKCVKENFQGTAQGGINSFFVKNSSLPFPPLSEQRRIVIKIEEMFTRLDAGVSALKKTQAQLKRYRQSVLKAACEGKLVPTEAELAKADGYAFEPVDVLLMRILNERCAVWKKNGKGSKYKEPIVPDTSGLPLPPEGWKYTSLDQLLTRILAGKSFKCEERVPNQNEIGVVKVSAVTWGEFDESESKTCMDSERINEAFLIKKGDFLFSRANTIELVGACVIVKQINKNLMLSDKILRFDFSVVPPQWILINLRNSFGRSEIERLATGNQESMRNIGQDRIREIRIPIPPLAEQRRIVAEIERRLSIADGVEKTVMQSLAQAKRLRQSILKRAFEGGLVAQDASDEPAGVLLKRIKVEKMRTGNGIRKSKQIKLSIKDVA